MTLGDKPLVWLHGEIKTPPFSEGAKVEAGYLLRRLQSGEMLRPPHSRPMPSMAPRCHELRIDLDAVVILEVFSKKTTKTPRLVIEACKRRLKEYEDA